jgi:hypothetical protein
MSADFRDITQLIWDGEADIIILFAFSFRQSNPCFIGWGNMDILLGSLSLKEKVDEKKIDKNVNLIRHQVFHPEPSSVDGLNLCGKGLSKSLEDREK